MALAAAAGFVASRQPSLRCGLVTVDHGLQAGSAQRAVSVATWATNHGFAPVSVATVDATAHPGGAGPEGAARSARYPALAAAARAAGAAAVLLGHTLEDQAETVLLAMARGSGPRGIAGMPVCRVIDNVPFLRPLLTVPRALTRAACAADQLDPWEDPHNADPSYARARIRALLPTLTAALGPGVVTNLARTARLVAADTEFLDLMAAECAATVSVPAEGLSAAGVANLAPALRGRVLRRWVLAQGVSADALCAAHIEALDALVIRWRGQGAVALPGGIKIVRRSGRLVVASGAV